jgi:hypothetical protein
MCIVALGLYEYGIILSSEYDELLKYFCANIPADITEGTYWWPREEKKPRLEWLEKHIEILDSNI